MKVNKIIYKIFFKFYIFFKYLKEKYKPELSNISDVPKNHMNQDGFFYFTLKDISIKSPSIDCYQSLYKPIFEREIYAFNSDRDEPYIIDCGANIGMGIVYWKTKYPKSRIVAFEPSKKVFESLQNNVSTFDNVKIINAAVARENGKMNFTVNESLSGSLFLEKDLGEEYIVDTVRLDKYLKNPVDFLKIDIEGEEINILTQIIENIKNIKNLFIEYHSFVTEPQILSAFLVALEENKFRYYIEGEYSHKAPLYYDHVNYKQDLQVGIWAKRLDN